MADRCDVDAELDRLYYTGDPTTPWRRPPVPVHVVPATAGDERMHQMGDACWCRPLNTFAPSADRRIEWRIVHQRRPDTGPFEE